MSISLCLPAARYLLSASDGGSWCITTLSTIQLLNYPKIKLTHYVITHYPTYVCKHWRNLVHFNTIHYPTVELSNTIQYWTIHQLNHPILNYPTAQLSNTELSNSWTIQYLTMQQQNYPKIKLSYFVLVPLSNFCLQVMEEARAIRVQLTLPPIIQISNNIIWYDINIMSSTHPLFRYPITNRFWQMNMRIKKVAFWGVRLSEKKFTSWLLQQWQSWMTLSSVILQNWPPYIFCLMYLFVNNWQVQKVFQSSHICDSSAAGTTYCNALKICDFLFFEWVQYVIKFSKIIIF